MTSRRYKAKKLSKLLKSIYFATLALLIIIHLDKPQMVSPIPDEMVSPIVEAKEEFQPKSWEGIASYYSRDGCLGCSNNLIMANGQTLDDNALTVAFNKVPLNSYVLITNMINGDQVKAKVTDTGGFEKLGRIIDLSVATKEIINCSDLCEVRVEEVL